jgi:hypothetical protein
MKYTFGYIEHDKEIHNRYLGPSMSSLKEEFEVITTSNKKFPAENYNDLLDRCKTEYLILTHQDVSFPSNLLEQIDETIKHVPDFGVLGMVGVDKNHVYRWSNSESIFEVDTLDCCFIVIRKDSPARFDSIIFNEYHLYVEDFCAQMNRLHGKSNYTIGIKSGEILNSHYKPNQEFNQLSHHSATVSKRGYCWGRYSEFRFKLEKKWPKIKTT